MSNGQPPNPDRDLLSRLNALKKSTIELDETKTPLAAHLAADEAQNANPAHALFSDLTSRFEGLKTAHNRGYTGEALKKDGTPLDIPELQNASNDKTVEELLAELGPDDQWSLGKDENLEIEALLKDAHTTLENTAPTSDLTTAAYISEQGTETRPAHLPAESSIPAIDLEIFQPEPDSDPDNDNDEPVTKRNTRTIDEEADETLRRLLDEIALDPTPNTIAEQASGDHEAGLFSPTPPTIPHTDPPPPYSSHNNSGSNINTSETDIDNALALRFASLAQPRSIPPNPSTEEDTLGLPSVPTGLTSKATPKTSSPQRPNDKDDDEIDSWCIICLDDASLKCLDCDGEPYCTKCWMEGHTGEDAGYEERRHRAVQFVKGGGLKKEKAKKARRLVGA